MRSRPTGLRPAILDGTPPPVPPEDGVANLRVIERIFAAADQSRAEPSK